MAGSPGRNFDEPDEVIEMPRFLARVVQRGDLTVGHVVQQPGWRWSEHVRPTVGGDWCQARHVGVLLSGEAAVAYADGTTFRFRAGDVIEVEPGHDAWTVGDEPCVSLEWTGLSAFTGYRLGATQRVLRTLLFTDVVESTVHVRELGDGAWRARLSALYVAARAVLDRTAGHEVNTTGDGLLAWFEGPAPALAAAAGIVQAARAEGLAVRVGVHVGEVEVVGADLRGIAVHEAARIMAEAAPDEILVSDVTRVLATPTGIGFADRGTHTLKGLGGEWPLFAYVPDAR